MYFVARFLPAAFLTTTTLGAGVARRNFTTTATTCKASVMDFPIGLGTYELKPEQLPQAIHSAIHLGYRRIDCAPVYFNEDKIGDVLAKEIIENNGAVSREDLFIVSKLASPFHRKEHVKIGLQKTLTDLRLEYLDLFLIHWPQAFQFIDIDPNKRGYENEDMDESEGGKRIDPSVSVHETWEAMEELVDQGLVRSIGVSNFPVSLLHELMTKSRIHPAVNQVEAHPYLQQTKLLKYCQARGVHFQAYSPLGSPGYIEQGEPRILDDPVLQKIAAAHNMSVANVCIAWATQRGTSIVVKSASPERQKENWRTQDNPITLSESEMAEIASLERGYRFFRPEDWWGAMAVFD
jgi:diketogulonate reductase-like aldo/keto reductase